MNKKELMAYSDMICREIVSKNYPEEVGAVVEDIVTIAQCLRLSVCLLPDDE